MVAHLSDLIRARVLQKYSGWWLDADTIVLKPLPSAEPYYYPTVAQKRSGGGYLDPSWKVDANSCVSQAVAAKSFPASSNI